MIGANATLLFQGDSITDAGRNRQVSVPNHAPALGHGYAYLATARLLASRPADKLRVFNRGISGNRVPDLHERWQEDCVALRPDVLSILIGVNDLWHKLDGRYDGSVDAYEDGFRRLLQGTRAALPDVRLVVCEPFVLRCGAVSERWFPEFDERREAARIVASEVDARFVPFQAMFERAIAAGTMPEYWAPDGVHPSVQGHQLMADAWLEATGASAT